MEAQSNSKVTLPLIYWLLVYSAVVGLISPLIFHNLIHNVAKAFLYGTAFASAATLNVMSRSPYLDRIREREEIEAAFRKDAITQSHVSQAVTLEMINKSGQYHDALSVLQNSAPEVQNQLIEEYGLHHLRALPQRPPAPPPKDLGLQLLKVAGSDQTDADFLDHLESWAICRDNNMTFVGNQGEGKTNACFFALYAWVYKCQAEGKKLPIIYAFDPHYGMGRVEGYYSTWLGVPVVREKPPTGIYPCVFHGDSVQLEEWLKPVKRLYDHRKKNQIGTASGAEPVIVVIDELTGHLAEMESKQAERVSDWMTAIATGAPKFNIWIWVITHDMTETNTKVKTAFYRQSHVVMGAASAQASHIVSSCQKNIPKGAIEIAGSMLRDSNRNPKVPACFVTSLPTPVGDSILNTPLLNNQQMELPWEQTDMTAKEDPYKGFDEQFKQKFGKDPDSAIKEEDAAKAIDVDAEEVVEPSKSGVGDSTHKTTQLPPAEQLADELAVWIEGLEQTPSLDEVRDRLLSELGIQEVSDLMLKGIIWLLWQRGIQI